MKKQNVEQPIDAAALAANTSKRIPPKPGGPAMNHWFITLLLIIAASTVSISVYDRYFATKVITVDMKGMILTQRDLYLAGKITTAQIAKDYDELEKSLKSLPKNRVAIMADAIFVTDSRNVENFYTGYEKYVLPRETAKEGEKK